MYTCQGWINGDPNGNNCRLTTPEYGPQLFFTISYVGLIDKNITVEFIRIQNPSTTKPTDTFVLYTQFDVKNNGTYYNIDKIDTGLTYQVTTPSELISAEVTRVQDSGIDSLRTGNPTTLFVELQISHALDAISAFQIVFPEAAQVTLNSKATSFTCNAVNYLGFEQSQLLCTVDYTNRTITIRNYCHVASCLARDYVRFKVYNDFINNYKYAISSYTASNQSLTIRSTTNELYPINEISTGIYITPQLIPNTLIMPSPEIVRGNNVINTKSSWLITFKINLNDVPEDGLIVIRPPQGTMIPISGQTVEVSDYINKTTLTDVNQTLYSDGTVNTVSVGGLCYSNVTGVSRCTVG